MPLVALILRNLGVPVLILSAIGPEQRIAATAIFDLLDTPSCAGLSEAQLRLDDEGIALLPIRLLHPGLARLLDLRARLGVRNSAHTIAKLLDPFSCGSACMAAMTHPQYVSQARAVLESRGAHAVLMRGTEGEAYANPAKRPQMEIFTGGTLQVAFDPVHAHLPDTIRAATRAGVTVYVVDGLDAARVRPILAAAVAQFDEMHRLRTELADANLKLSERKMVERAKGILMQRKGFTEPQPKLLLLDEPFGALDALTRAQLQNELMRIVAATGSTTVMVTHDVDEAVLLSDRIVMLTNGPAATIGEILSVGLPCPLHSASR